MCAFVVRLPQPQVTGMLAQNIKNRPNTNPQLLIGPDLCGWVGVTGRERLIKREGEERELKNTNSTIATLQQTSHPLALMNHLASTTQLKDNTATCTINLTPTTFTS